LAPRVKFWQGTIEREDKHLAWTAEHVSKKNEEARRAALKAIGQANMWEEEAKRLRKRAATP
jgi:hypothetical protein